MGIQELIVIKKILFTNLIRQKLVMVMKMVIINFFLMRIVLKLDETNQKLSIILHSIRVCTRFNLSTLKIIRNKIKSYWKKYVNIVVPFLFGQWTPSINIHLDVYIDNFSQSVILQIKVADIIPTQTYPSKFTIMFARVVNPRFDKIWKESLKYDELLNYYNISISNDKKNNVLFGGELDED